MTQPLLFHRFLGIWFGTLVAESIAGAERHSDSAARLRWQVTCRLAARGHGALDEAIADWDWHLLQAVDWVRATLPLAFFFHDEPEHWVARLTAILALDKEKCQLLRNWANIVADILVSPQLPVRAPSVPDCNRQKPIVQALEGDPMRAIALAQFYSQDTPHHFQLAVLRSWRGTSAPEVASLTGTLMGGRLGVGRIPWRWQRRPEVADLLTDSHLLLESLWMQWLGCPHSQFSLPVVGAIATATTLQPRPRLALVSQRWLLRDCSSHPQPVL